MKLETAESLHSSSKDGSSSPRASARSGSISTDRSDAVVDEASQNGVNDRETGEEYVKGVKLMLILVSTTVVYFLMMLDMSILATAIPYITDDFHSLLDIGWYGSAYQLASASLQPLTGKMYARLNSKWCFLAFLLLFEVGSLICGVASSSPMLIVGRAVAGLGGSGLMNGGITILNSCIPPAKQPGVNAFKTILDPKIPADVDARTAYLGIMMALGYLGIAFGPLIGGALTEYASWRWCFYINLPVGGVAAFFFLMLHIPDQIAKPGWKTVLRRPFSEFDLIGFALFAPSSVQCFLALQFGGNKYAWNSATIIGLFCGAGATFLVWIVWNYRQGDKAMVPLSLLRKKTVWASCAAGLFFAGSLFITGYYLPIYFQAVRGASPLMSGVDVLPNILPQMFMSVIAGKLVERWGYYLPLMLICGVLNSISSGLLALLSPTTPTGQWVGYQVMLGIARGCGISMPIIAIQNTPQIAKAQIPVAISTMVFSQNFGGAVMVSLSQTIFSNSLHHDLPRYAPLVDAQAVIAAGSTKMRDLVTDSVQLKGVLNAYSVAIDRIFYLCAGISVMSLVLSWWMGWIDVRVRKDDANPDKVHLKGEEMGKVADGIQREKEEV